MTLTELVSTQLPSLLVSQPTSRANKRSRWNVDALHESWVTEKRVCLLIDALASEPELLS